MDVAHDLGDALFFLEDAGGQLFRRQMRHVFFGAGILAVQVAAVGENLGGADFPCAVGFLALGSELAPPLDAIDEVFKLNRRGLGVIFPAFGQRLLIIPDVLRRPGTVEKQNVRRNARVGRKDSVGQANNRVEVEVLQKFLLDPGANAVAKERSVGHDYRRARPGRAPRDGSDAVAA